MGTSKELAGMSLPPPPPPPVPPPVLAPDPTDINQNAMDTNEDLEELTTLCTRNWKYLTQEREDVVVLTLYNPVASIIQQGPTCGLVAMAMAGKRLDNCATVTARELLEDGLQAGYTNQGEMFSAVNMAKLAENKFSVVTEIKENLREKREELAQHLSRGWPVLIPYDADANHEPCLRNGHKAHWSIILGFCLILKKSHYLVNEGTLRERIETISGNVVRLAEGNLPVTVLRTVQDSECEQFFLLAKQGKSKHLKLFDFNQLCLSNCNLVEVNKDKYNIKHFVLPDNGTLEGLRNKAIFIRPKFDNVNK